MTVKAQSVKAESVTPAALAQWNTSYGLRDAGHLSLVSGHW